MELFDNIDNIGKLKQHDLIDLFKIHSGSVLYVISKKTYLTYMGNTIIEKKDTRIENLMTLEGALTSPNPADPTTPSDWILFANNGYSHLILVPVFGRAYCPPGKLKLDHLLEFHDCERKISVFGRKKFGWKNDVFARSIAKQYENEILRYNGFGIDIRNLAPFIMRPSS